MTKKEKEKLYEPKKYALYINGRFYSSYPSHAAAKKAMHFKKKESYDDWSDEVFEIKPYER